MTLALIYSRTEVFMCGKKQNKNKKKGSKSGLPPRLLYNRSRAEQEGIFYPSWSLICAKKREIKAN